MEFRELNRPLAPGTLYVQYGQFVDENAELLKAMPAPRTAVEYYRAGDLYLFDSFQTSRFALDDPRRPPCRNLFDVFSNIRDDESEHVKTMRACQDLSIVEELQIKRQKDDKNIRSEREPAPRATDSGEFFDA